MRVNLVGTHQTNTNLPPVHPNGIYDFTLKLVTSGTNGPVVSQTTTQTVPVINGLFQVPLPGDASAFMSGTPSWLLPAVRPSGGGAFTPLNPPLPIAPAPQAFYTYTAGTVADLASGQAVTSLNGLRFEPRLGVRCSVLLIQGRNRHNLSPSPTSAEYIN